MELKKLIESGLNYIEFPDYDPQNGITINQLIEVREHILQIDEARYQKLFPTAFDLDQKEHHYDSDGFEYYVDETTGLLKSCKLYQSAIKLAFTPPLKFSFELPFSEDKTHPDKTQLIYNYLNEIDHFFTHSIYLYLIGKDSVDKRNFQEPGLKSVFMKIPVQTDK